MYLNLIFYNFSNYNLYKCNFFIFRSSSFVEENTETLKALQEAVSDLDCG